MPDELIKQIAQRQEWSQFALGGLFVLLLVERLSSLLLRYRKNHHSQHGKIPIAGEQSVDFWVLQHKKGFTESFQETVLPVLERQTEILREIKDTNQQIGRTLTRMIDLAERNHGTSIGTST